MDADLLFITGIVLAVLSVPSILSAFSEARAPRVAAFTIIASGVMIFFAVRNNPELWAIEQVPEAFVRVVARYIL